MPRKALSFSLSKEMRMRTMCFAPTFSREKRSSSESLSVIVPFRNLSSISVFGGGEGLTFPSCCVATSAMRRSSCSVRTNPWLNDCRASVFMLAPDDACLRVRILAEWILVLLSALNKNACILRVWLRHPFHGELLALLGAAKKDAGLPDTHRRDPHNSGESPALQGQSKRQRSNNFW